MIPRGELVVGRWYEIEGRSIESPAYWDGEGFIGKRTKFGNVFDFKEYHWDDGPPFGTVKPLREEVVE